MGRKPLPKAVKILRGTHQPCRDNPAAPTPSDARPEPPGILSPRAGDYFRALVDLTEEQGYASASHAFVYQLAAQRLEELETLDQKVRQDGYTYTTTSAAGDTMIRANPAVSQRSECLRHLHSLLSELGLTPSAVGKVGAKTKQPANPWEGF